MLSNNTALERLNKLSLYFTIYSPGQKVFQTNVVAIRQKCYGMYTSFTRYVIY